MHRTSLVFASALVGLSVTAYAGLPPDIDGVWAREDGSSRVRIAPCGDQLCATNIWVKPADTKEKVGDVLVMRVKPTDDGSLTGEAFDQRRDLRYSMDITVKGSEMTSKGCIIGGLICKSSTWSRAN